MKKNILILFILLFTVFLSFDIVLAAEGDQVGDPPVVLKNPLGNEPADTDVNLLIANIIKVVLGVVGSVALLMFVYGGFIWMIASGNNERVEKGKNILIWATIGLIVIFASYAMVEFIIKAIVGTP